MYAQHFGLSKDPFSIAPDPRFLFMSEKHREALAHLLYGVGGGGGFVLLTGEIGAGKTTVCRAFLEQIPAHCDVAYIFNPKLTVAELLRSVCEEFRVKLPVPANGRDLTIKEHVDALNAFLLAAHAGGRSALLIIDEAQSLAAEVLEQLRLLTNLETHERKLLQIILIGQPELRDMLARPGLEQLAQRVIARYHLRALTAGETVRYVQHRLAVAGGGASVPFEPDAMSRLFQLTGGVPRRINLLAGRSLLGAYAKGQEKVSRSTVEGAAREVFDMRKPRPSSRGSRTGGTLDSAPASSYSGRGAAGAVMAKPAAWPWALGVAVGLGLVGGLGVGAWAWRDVIRGADPAATPAGPGAAATAPAPGASAVTAKPGAGGNAAATSAAAGAGSSGLVPGPRAGAGALAPAVNGAAGAGTAARLDEPAALLAAAWSDEAQAWRALAVAWKAPLAEGDACAAAAQAGLACFRTRGGLAAVRQLDRPGVVTLRARDDAPSQSTGYALLVALDEQVATLQTQGRHWRLSPAALATLWRGDFGTLWRTPPGWREAEGALAARTRIWVQERLAAAGQTSKATQPLRERIWAYQVAQGLQPDGLAGPMTMMQLAREGGSDEPRLVAER
jgi:general secretion pathway protein A